MTQDGMFKKLNLLHDLTFFSGALMQRYGGDTGHGWQGISYYSANQSVVDKVLLTLPADYRSKFNVSLMIINQMELPAHTDDNILVSVNFYIETADAITKFYKVKTGQQAKTIKLENQDDGAIFDADCLDLVGEFKANKNEVWVLDVKKPHSVSCSTNSTRTAYCLQSSEVSYEQTLNITRRIEESCQA
jgi:hypothetical protein